MKVQKLKHRITWGFNPVTRVVKSKKRYSRNKLKDQKEQQLKSFNSLSFSQ